VSFQDCSGGTGCGGGAVQAMSSFAAEEFERIAALSQTLLELMKHPRFYSSPALAAAQLSAISHLAEEASVTIDQMAAKAGFSRAAVHQDACQDALHTFLRNHPSVRHT
jgi:hypothetical protein